MRACKVSEFACKGSGICLPLDKYCDGFDHCGDLSDEPKFCTGELKISSLSHALKTFFLFQFAIEHTTVMLEEPI